MTTRASPSRSSRFSRGRSKNGSPTTAASAARLAIRLSIVAVVWKEHDVAGSHRQDARLPGGSGFAAGVELVDLEQRGARSNAVLGELAEVRRAFDGDGEGVRGLRAA